MKNNKKKITVKCEQNVCPICGGMNLDYGCSEDDDHGRTFPWTCEDCGATGKEGYTETFDGNHYDVETGDGESVEIVAPEAAPAPDEVCPVCGGKLEYDGEPRFVKSYLMERDWCCTKCRATGYGSFEEESLYHFIEHEGVRLADGSEWDGQAVTGTIQLAKVHAYDMDEAMATLAAAGICAFEENGLITILQEPVDKAAELLAVDGFMIHAIAYIADCSPVTEKAAAEAEADEECPQFNDQASPPAPVKAATGWFVPVTWEMFGVVRIPFEDAPTLADAFKQIKDNPNIALPKGHYVDDSFAPSYELEQIEEVRSAYNDNRPDEEV